MVTFAYPYLHLVITDVLMPKLDGRALGQRLRERWPELPVLYISGYPAIDIFHPDEATAFVPFMQKPIDTDELVAVVGRLLTSRLTTRSPAGTASVMSGFDVVRRPVGAGEEPAGGGPV
jgi:DNA-binding NtrC family response regulator